MFASQGPRGELLQVAFSHLGDAEPAPPARLPEYVAEQLALRGVDEGVRGQDVRKTRQRAPRREEKAAGHRFVPPRAQLRHRLPHRALREGGGLVDGTPDQVFGRREGPSLGGVEGLSRRPT